MTFYLATRDNLPFYTAGEKLTKEEWMQKLHLNNEQFETLISNNCGSFQEIQSNLSLLIYKGYGIDGKILYIQRTGGIISDEEIESLQKEILPLLEKYDAQLKTPA